MTIKLARDLPPKPFNTTIPRFHSKFWTIDYNALMVGTIIQVDERGFKIPSQWRTNSDFMGVKWISEDKLSHEYFKYSTDNNYRDTVLAFRANPSEPAKFTATITAGDVPLTYRLVPYAYNPVTDLYEPLDTEYNTGRTYPASIMRAQGEWTVIPDEDMVPFKGRSDYIFILDFSDMRMFSQFNGPVIVPEEISSISFDTIEWNHGLGKDAKVQSMEQVGDRVKVKITGAVPGAILTPGDRLTVLGKFRTTTTNTIGTGRGNAYTPYLPGTFAPERVRPRPANRDIWPAAAERTWLMGFRLPEEAPGVAPLSDTARAYLSLQGYRDFQVKYEDDVFDYWQEPWQVNGMDVTNIEVATWTPTFVAFWVTFETKGVIADEMRWNSQDYPGGNSYFMMLWANFTYPCYAVSSQEIQFVVEDWGGFGTGEVTVWYTGKLIGDFIGCDTFYSRYLAATAPAEVVNSTKYYVDMTVTGARTTILQKNHPQPAHDLMMTSGFDDGYNMTPARQVDAVYGLGYRGHWTKYLGMSHYFNGRTAWQDKITGEIIPVGRPNDISIMFAGDQAVGGHFTTGQQPDRGLEEFQRVAAQKFDVAYGQVLALNGAVGSTAADRAAAFDPNDEKFDPDAGLPGGLWWWDLDANEPGPALLNCINKAIRGQPPKAVVWGCGQQDFQAISSPGNRNPVPTVERTTAATKAVFAYFRSVWGADLSIFLQGIGWIWGKEAGAAAPGAPMYLSAKRNSWGDVVLQWLSYNDDPAGREYLVDIYHPNRPDEILRTYTASGDNIHDGLITFDWAVELNVAPAVEVFGDQFPWSYLRWRVRRVDNPDLASNIQESFVELSNAKVVKQMCLLGINSLIGGYFNDLSDPLKPGGTGNPGRKDVVAASTFRRTLAQNAGLRDVEVMPVMVVVGSSPINPMPYQPGFPLTNYWWDPVTNTPGPNLIIADGIVKELGMPPSFFVESGPGETTGIPYAPAADRPAILARWRTSNIAMLAWMRENWGNAAMEIWFQGATTSFWGDPPPVDVNAEGTQLIRDLQTSMSLEGIGFKLGSYVPDSNKWETFRNEMAQGIGWVHYSVEGYHAAAVEMGEAIALNINRALTPPDWATLRQPTGLNVTRKPNNDIHITWDTRPNFDRWYYRNLRGDTQEVITEGVLATAEYVFTEAAQIAEYGAPVDFIVFDVSEYILATNLIGPSTRFAGSPGSGDSDLASVTGLVSAVQLNGDIVTTWTARPGHSNFYFRNLKSDTAAVLAEGPLTSPTFTFTVAQQIAAYGFAVTYSRCEVAEYDPALDITGPFSVWNDEAISPLNPLAPITGFLAKFSGTDIVMTWDASPTAGRQYRLRNLRADTSAVISDSVLTSATYTFTTAEQIAEYGFTAGFIVVEVMEHDPVTGLDGPVFSYNGTPV